MATRTIIDGGKQAITFNNDTDPVAVYVDGELQQNVSFVPQLAQGTGSAQYTSEYKKNHINCELTGTTEQGTYVGNIVQTSSLVPYASFVEDFTISSYGRILRSTQPIDLPTTSGSVVAKLVDYESIESQIPDYETLFLINENKDTLYVLYTANTESSQLIPTNDTYYLGIADEMDAGNDNVRCYNLFVQNAKLQVEYSGTSTIPTPETPCPIENANDEGMSVTVHGYNLLNKEEFSSRALRNETEISIYGAIALENTIVNAILKPNTTYTISYDIEGVAGMPSGATRTYGQGLRFINSAYQAQAFGTLSNKIANEGEIYTHISTFTTPTDLYEGVFKMYVYTGRYSLNGVNTYATCIIRNVQIVEGAESKPFQPYFREEIAIPAEITSTTEKPIISNDVALENGATVDLNMASISLSSAIQTKTSTDCLTVDRLSNKVLYHQNVGKKILTSTNMSWSYNSQFGLFLSRTNIGAENVWLPILANKYIGYSQVGHIRTKDYGITTDALWWSGSWECALTIRDIRFDNINDFKADLDQNPLIVEYGLAEEITHDITNTDLGQSLLNLATQNQTNYFEITSNEKAPKVPIKITYAKWGELVENNNNT